MKIVAISGSQVTLELTAIDGRAFHDALNEVCNGFPVADFPRVLGGELPVARALLEHIHKAMVYQQDPRAIHHYFFTMIDIKNCVVSTRLTLTDTEVAMLRNALKEAYRVLAVQLHELHTRMGIGEAKLLALQAVLTTLQKAMSQLAPQQKASFHPLDLPDLISVPVLQSIEAYEQTHDYDDEPDPRLRGGVLSQKQYELFTTIKPGTLLKGRVSKLRASGVFVTIDGFNRWIPKNEDTWSPVHHPGDTFYIGQEVEVQVVSVDTEHLTLTCSLKTGP